MEDPSAHRVWDTALGQLQLQVTRPNYDTWLKDTIGLSADNGSFVIGTPSDFVSEWLSAKMGPVIAKTVAGILGREVSLGFRVVAPRENGNGNGYHAEPATRTSSEFPAPAPAAAPRNNNRLNAKFTFERFIIGESNRLAATAAITAADQPGEVYNPVFIYGASGLGKTHLLHAISHRSAGRGVLYATCEQFTNEFLTAINQGHQEEFRRRFRSNELFLIDDVEFLGGKERTQEEFFHTFDILHTAGCQIVLTCDGPPASIPSLEARLCSRFQWGLVADIQPPDEETRLAILRAKALEQRIEIAPEVAHLLADRAQDNIRELEGFLNRVAAYASLTRSPITTEVATAALNALTPPSPSSPPSPRDILDGVSRYFGLSLSSLQGPSRAKPIAEARHVAMYLLREEAQLSLKQVGYLLGNRDHSTVIHGCRQVSTRIATAKGRHQLSEIQAQIRSA